MRFLRGERGFMIRTCRYKTPDLPAIRELNPFLADEICFHQDVIPESVFVAKDRKTLLGVGFLCRNPSDTHVSLEYDVNVSDARGIDAAAALLEALTDCFRALHEEDPERFGTLRLWCKAHETDLREFLEAFGFRAETGMIHMGCGLDSKEPEASAGSGKSGEGMLETVFAEFRKTGLLKTEKLDLLNPAVMAEYLDANAEGFGIPDSPNEMIFRIQHCGARVYGVTESIALREETEAEPAGFSGKIIAAVTLWPLRDGGSASENIFCRAEYRRKGITSGLLESLLSLLKSEGAKAAELNVYEDDLPAISMYEKCGYREKYRLLEMTLREADGE